MSGPCTDCGGPDYLTLEARIAELEAENASMADDLCSMTGAYERAEQAEAELAELRHANELLIALDEAKTARIVELEAQYSDVCAGHENELALRLEAEAELARLKSGLLHNRTSGGRPEMGTKP